MPRAKSEGGLRKFQRNFRGPGQFVANGDNPALLLFPPQAARLPSRVSPMVLRVPKLAEHARSPFVICEH